MTKAVNAKILKIILGEVHVETAFEIFDLRCELTSVQTGDGGCCSFEIFS